MHKLEIALIGNPNCGKTTLFNTLTGSHQRVGNWPGVTVDKKTGYYVFQGQQYDVVDLPGTYAIENSESDISQDELIARDFVQSQSDSLIVNILDATNLQRNLYLTFQLLDLNRPLIVVLNMMDALEDNGEQLDIDELERQLGCPVVGVSANKGEGIEQLYQTIAELLANPVVPQPAVKTLGAEQDIILQRYLTLLQQQGLDGLTRWHLLELLLGFANDKQLTAGQHNQLDQCREELAQWCCGEEIDIVMASARYNVIDDLCRRIIIRPRQASTTLTEKIDRIALGRITGIPVFLAAMYLMFLLAINFGSVFIDFFDVLFETIFVKGTTELLHSVNSPDWLTVILAHGIGSGIQTVATFIPVISAMFLCLSFLEDSGYLARAAMVVDRGMRAIGLPGKAFVPMLVGFGCGVPAIMSTRTLENSRDRLMSIMMIPFMSCGARLPVYALFAAVFFPSNGQNVVFSLYLLGIAAAILTGFALKYTILPGENTPFIMELPPYRLPTLRGLFLLTWQRLKSFIIRAGKAIVMMVMVLSLLNSIGMDGSFGHQDTDKSVLSSIGRHITPLFEPMGIVQQNWPATVGIFTGIFAKEAVIGTLNSLYSQQQASDDEAPFDLIAGIKEALMTIPQNLSELGHAILDPLKISTADGDLAQIQKQNSLDTATVKQIYTSFGSAHAAMAYLIFILLYTPCAAALGAVYREAGSKWTALVAVWTFVLGWIVATAYYQFTQLGSVNNHAISWLIGLMIFSIALLLLLKLSGRWMSNQLPVSKKSGQCSKGCC